MFKLFKRHECAKKTAKELDTRSIMGELSDEALEKIQVGSDHYRMFEEGGYVCVTHFSPYGKELYTEKFLIPYDCEGYEYVPEAGKVVFFNKFNR